ncbi:MAG TPA: hypothetical protein VJR89_18145 [Polyangiales bacterium]|nr:hypothetical protein [Polyangiales bacterium]
MHEAAQAFARALAEERRAALQADFDGLLRVQEEKRALLPALRAASIDADAHRELSEAARQNIALIRHLFLCVKGYLGASAEPGYTARGEVSQAAVHHVRGRL